MQTDKPKYLYPYFPDIILKTLSSPVLKQADSIIHGHLLFADLSGFTAISEKLAALGRLGGEKLADIMNECFDSLLGIVFGAGGDIIKFGGDAFLALFQGDRCSERTINCAGNLINWISGHGRLSTEVGDFSLGIHCGISSGPIYNLVIGSRRKEHLFCGRTVEQAYAAADVAQLGQLALTPKVAVATQPPGFEKDTNGFCILQNFATADILDLSERPPADEKARRADLDKFMIAGLQEQLYYNDGVIQGEHRVLSNLFIGIKSIRRNLELDFAAAAPIVSEYFDIVNDAIEMHGGSLARLDACASSEKILAFFGAPISTGHDAIDCLKAILQIEDALPRINNKLPEPITHQYGANSGLCFVGNVGGKARHEYTAMGDAINLAARLMGKAEKSLIGEATIKAGGHSFIAPEIEPIRVKGKAEPVRVFVLQAEKSASGSDSLIIGRDQEIAKARRFVDDVKHHRRSLLLITGEPGAGKSLLTARLKSLGCDAALSVIEGACYKHSEKSPYEPLKAILSGLLGLGTKSSRKQRRAALLTQLGIIGEPDWEPLLAHLLDYFPVIPPHLKNLPEDIKKSKIRDLLNRLICSLNKQKPSLLIIEDVQWLDNASFDLVKSLSQMADIPALVFVSRPGEIFDELKDMAGVETIELGGLPPESSRELFLSVLGGTVPAEDIIGQVIEKSGGNPFYLEEMAKAYLELGPDKFAAGENIPTGIESVITARIDNLGEMVKKTVRTASVIGRVFAFNVLKDIFPDRRRTGKLRDYLDQLAHLDLTPLERRQPVLEYIFKHILTQEVAYNGLSFTARRALHLKAAEYYAAKRRLASHHPEIPARHYLQAGEEIAAMPFLLKAGLKAASEFANKEAFDFYEKVISIAEKSASSEFQIQAYQARGELAKHTGDFKLAESDYLNFKSLVADDTAQEALSLRHLSDIYRLTADYDKAKSVLNDLESLLPDDIENRVFCLNGRAEIDRRQGKLQACHDRLAKTLDLFYQHDIAKELQATIHNNLGICLWSLGQLQQAASHYKSAHALYRRLKDLNGQAKIINNLGILSDEMGKLRQAAQAYEKAGKIFKRIGSLRSEAFACANLGTNLSTRGYLATAHDKLLQASEIFNKIGDSHSLAFTIGDLGMNYYRRGELDQAVDHFSDALRRGNQIGDNEFILESTLRLARVKMVRAELSMAEIDGLIGRAKKVSSQELQIKAMIIKGMISLGGNNLREVDRMIDELNRDCKPTDFPELEAELGKLRAILLVLRNQPEKAGRLIISSLKKAIKNDLAVAAFELAIVADACGLSASLPRNILDACAALHERLAANLAEPKLIEAFRRNRIETLRSFMKDYRAQVPVRDLRRSPKISEYSDP